MNFELTTLVGLGSAYLCLLFGIAYLTEQGWIPQRLVRHPVVYVLSLGVFASVWAYYTAVGNAQRKVDSQKRFTRTGFTVQHRQPVLGQ